MLAFITSIRHPHNFNSWSKVESLLYQTLDSVCNQDDQNFVVIVVHNKECKFHYSHHAVSFLSVDFSPPSQKSEATTGMEAIRIDRGSKYYIGLLKAKKIGASHIFFFDADDFVSSKISGFVNSNIGQNGWFGNSGYIYSLKTNRLKLLENNFNQLCGTCNILKTSLLYFNDTHEIDTKQSEIFSSLDSYYLRMVLGSHKFTPDYFNKRGQPLSPLPFPIAVYQTGTGENHSGFNKTCGNSLKPNSYFENEFKLPIIYDNSIRLKINRLCAKIKEFIKSCLIFLRLCK